MSRPRLVLFIVWMVAVLAACPNAESPPAAPAAATTPAAIPAPEKALSEYLNDLAAADASLRRTAIDKLGREGGALVEKMTARLAAADQEERKAIFEVFDLLGGKALPAVIDGLAVVYQNREVIDGITTYFRKQGEAGYRALLESLEAFSALTGEEVETPGTLERLDEHYQYFDSVALIMARLTEYPMVGQVPALLTNSYQGIRTRAAFLLCLKGWRPDHPRDKVIFNTHLMTAPTCPSLPDPKEEAARLAAQDLAYFLEVEREFPAGGRARDEALAATGSDEVADYLYRQATETDSEFQLLSLYRKLQEMKTDRAAELAGRLRADPQRGLSLRSLDPDIR